MGRLALATALGLVFVPVGGGIEHAAAVPEKAAADCTIVGTQGADVLKGGARRDVICGLGGDDRIAGKGGNDVLRGGRGDDTVGGGNGDDRVEGNGGDDELSGGNGDDWLGGFKGSDALRARDGAAFTDTLRCGPGNDEAFVDAADIVRDTCDLVAQIGGPVAVDDAFNTPEDTDLTLPVTGTAGPAGNDTDPDGDPLAVSNVSGASGGSVSIVGGNVRFVPTPDRCGPAAGGFSYTVSDGKGGTDDGKATVNIGCLPDAPGANDDTATHAEDSAATAINVLNNDTDADGDPLTIASVTQPPNGTVVITGGGTGLTYAPTPNYCNTPPGTTSDAFTYTLTPGESVGKVAVTVTCVDDLPSAANDTKSLPEDAAATTIDALNNDTDIDAGPKKVNSVNQPGNGTVVITNGGDDLTYEPDTNYCNSGGATDDFTYNLNGGSQASVAVTVTCIDDAPTAADDTQTVLEDALATSIDVRSNDTDTDSGPKTVASVVQPAHGTVAITNGGDDLTYTPNPNYCNSDEPSSTDDFTYKLNGGSQGHVRVTVTCVNDPSTAVDDTKTVVEDSGTTTINALENDTDADGKLITAVTQPTNGTAVITNSGTDLSYTPNANYCNDPPGVTTDDFTYTLNGAATGTVEVTVTCDDDPPTAVDDTATVDEDATATTIDVRVNDTNADGGPKTIISVVQPENGTVAITNGGDDLTYTPDADYCNTTEPTDDFTYKLNGNSQATVAITVTCINDDPKASDDTDTALEDAAATTIDVLANDTDDNLGAKTIASVTQPTNGTVVITNAGADLTYKPNHNYCNTGGPADEFSYTLNGTPGSTATVKVTVTCVDDDPTAFDDLTSVTEDSSATSVDVLANDTDDALGNKTVASVTQPANGTVAITNAGGELTYTPNPNYCNTAAPGSTDDFTYTLNGSPGSTATVTVTVTCVDDDPTATNDNQTVSEDSGTTTIDVLANDTNADGGPLTVASATQATHGTVAITNGGNDLTYTPNANYCNDGTPTDDFTYTLNGTPGSTATVKVTVNCVNDAPNVDLDTTTAGEDSTSTFNETSPHTGEGVLIAPNASVTDVDSATVDSATVVLSNRADGDSNEMLNFTIPTGSGITSSSYNPTTGTITFNGNSPKAHYTTLIQSIRYDNTKNPPNATNRNITVQVNGGSQDSNVANAVVIVEPINAPPTLDLDSTDASNDSSATFSEDGSAVAVAPNAAVADADAGDQIESATITLINRPDAAAESLSATLSAGVTSAVYTSSTGVLLLTGSGTPAQYETVLRTVRYDNTSQAPSTANRAVTFKVNDGQNDSTTRTSTVSVTAVNDAPVNTVPGAQSTNEDTGKTLTGGTAVSVADIDAGSNPLQLTLSVTNGTLTLVTVAGLTFSAGDGDADTTMTFTGTQGDINTALGDGLTYNPTDNYNGGATLTVLTEDQGANPGPNKTDNDTVAFSVDPVNDAPLLADTNVALDAVDEDAPAPTGAVGTLISALVDFPGGGGNNNVTDADTTPQTGVAITAADTSNGAWFYTVNGGANWLPLGAVSPNNARLLASDPDTRVFFQPAANYAGTVASAITFRAWDRTSGAAGTTADTSPGGGATSFSAETDTASITVNPVNDPPSLGTSSFTPSYTEDGAATNVDNAFTVTDPDSATMDQATLTLAAGTYKPGDDLQVVDQLGITGAYSAATRTLTLTATTPGTVSKTDWATALSTVKFATTHQDPGTVRTVTVQINDGATANKLSTPVDKTITVVPVNDAPALSQPDAGTLPYTEDTPAENHTLAIAPNLTTADVDNTNLSTATAHITGNYQNGQDVLAVPNGGPLTGNFNATTGVLTLTPVTTATAAQFQTALRAVSYSNTSDAPDPSTRTITFQVDDGQSSNHASNTVTRDVSVVPTNDKPIADDENFNGATQKAIPNTPLNVGTSVGQPSKSLDCTTPANCTVLTGDTDPDTPFGSLTIGPTGAKAITTADGGKVTIEADGNFTYFPKAGTSCTDANRSDNFDYTVSDNDTGDAPSPAQTDTGTVTLALTSDCIWYIDTAAAAGGDGTGDLPFDALADVTGATGADAAGDTLFILNNGGTLGGATGLTLLDNQRLLSRRHGLVLESGATTVVPASGGNPSITNSAGNALTLASGNTIQGIDLGSTPAANAALKGTNVGTATMNTVTSGTINNTTGGAVDLSTGTLAMTFTAVSSNNSAGDGIRLDNAAGTFTASGGSLQNAGGQDVDISGNNTGDTVDFTYNGTIADTTGTVVSISNQNGGTKDFNGTIGTAASPAGSVTLTNNTGATIRFDGGTILSTGASNALSATGGGTITVTDPNANGTAPDNTLTTTSGIALTVSNTTIGADDLTFKSISTNGGANGIVLNTTGSAGTTTVTGDTGTTKNGSGGTIANTTGAGISLTNVRDITFDQLNLSNIGGSGVNGTQVTNFSYTNSTFTTVGDGTGPTDQYESAIAFNNSGTNVGNNIDGTLVVTGNTFTDANYSAVDLQSNNGTVSNANISNNTMTNPGFAGINIVGANTTTTSFKLTKATLANNTVTSAKDGIQVIVSGAEPSGPGALAGTPGTSDIVSITGNSVTVDDNGTHAINVGTGGGNPGSRTKMNFEILNNGTPGNPLLGSDIGTVILIGNNGHSDMSGTITSNVIDANHTVAGAAANGIAGGNGAVASGTAWTPELDLTVSNNTITDTDGNGILLVGRGTNGHADLSITGNNVGAPLSGNRPGIRVDAGNSSAGSDDEICLNISNNTSGFSGSTGGIGVRKEGASPNTHDFGFVGISPATPTTAQVEAHIEGQNPAGGGAFIVNGDGYESCTFTPGP